MDQRLQGRGYFAAVVGVTRTDGGRILDGRGNALLILFHLSIIIKIPFEESFDHWYGHVWFLGGPGL